jgi:hypothetical protein
VHLVVSDHGTPGPTLCGIDRFNGVGWGMADRNYQNLPGCANCFGQMEWLING